MGKNKKKDKQDQQEGDDIEQQQDEQQQEEQQQEGQQQQDDQVNQQDDQVEVNNAQENQQQEGEQKDDGPSLMEKTNDYFKNIWDWSLFWWELVGTALFAYGICASDGQDWYVSFSLFAGILFVSPFCGGHLNPAVSFGFLIKNGIVKDIEGNTSWNFREFFARSVGQFFGACIGGALAFTILGMSAAPTIPSDDFTMLGGYFTGEAFGTCLFVLAILIMTDDRTKLVDETKKDSEGKTIERPKGFGKDILAIVATIALALHYSRSFTYKTGGGLNPGIAVGLQIWFAIDEQSWEPLIHSWLFVVGPLLGALVSSYYYSLFHIAAVEQTGCFDPNPKEVVKDKEQEQDKEQVKNEDQQKEE